MSISIPQADFTPQLAGYTGQGAFRFWCQKVLPIVYDDSLSYYELLNKVVVYLNNVISDVATVEDNVGELSEAYVNLQNYVNEHTQEIAGVVNEFTDYVTHYLENLDVQEEINTKLDNMVLDGTLTELIEPLVASSAPSVVTEWLENNITPTTPPVDGSLTISGAAADAKVTGDKLLAVSNEMDAMNTANLNPRYFENYNSVKGIYPFYIDTTGWYNSETFNLTSGVEYKFCIFLPKPVSSSSYFRLLNNNTVLVTRFVGAGTSTITFTYTPDENIDSARFNMSVNVAEYPVTVMCYYGLSDMADYTTPLSNSLLPAYKDFDTVGDANALKINRTYLVKNSDVVPGANLPDKLAKELPVWPAVITSFASSEVRGAQIIVSTNNIFFRTITYNNGVVVSGSKWRTLSTEVESRPNNTVSNFIISDTYSEVNGAFLKKALVNNAMDCTPSGVYGAHESNIYVYDNKIYLVMSANKVDSSEDLTKYNLELVVRGINGSAITNRPIISVGDVFEGKTVRACQAGFILPIGTNIHIYCDVCVDATDISKFRLIHTVYNTQTDNFSSFENVYYKDPQGTNVLAENGEQYISTNWFNYSGHSWCTSAFFNTDNCGIAFTEDFVHFDFIARLENHVASMIGAGGEITAAYSSVKNRFLVAGRTPNNKNYLVFVQYNIAKSEWEDVNYVPDATSRPMFFTYNGDIYLANNSPYTRSDVTIWKYITQHNWYDYGTLEPVSVARLNAHSTYFSFYVYSGEIYMAHIYLGLQKIYVSKIKPETKTKSQISDTLLALFS